MLKKFTPFFIVGSPRSGTTLLERMLNSHSDIFVPPETEYFRALSYEKASETEIGALERFAATYASWQPVRLLGITADDLIRMAGQSKTYSNLFMHLMAFLADRVEKGGVALIGEKTPLHLHHVDQILQMFPDARFISTVRDGRAVVASRMKHPLWNSNLVTFSRQWAKDGRAIRRLQEQLEPPRILVVRYEDMIDNSRRELGRVCDFLEVDFEPAMLSHQDKASKGFDDYYQQPWMSKSTTAIDASRVEAWQKELDGSAQALVERMIRQELIAFGYEPLLHHPVLPINLWLKENARDLSLRLARKIFSSTRPL